MVIHCYNTVVVSVLTAKLNPDNRTEQRTQHTQYALHIYTKWAATCWTTCSFWLALASTKPCIMIVRAQNN